MKQGSNKRLLADNVEIMRLSRRNNYLRAEEIEVYGTSIDDIDKQQFSNYFIREFGRSYEERGLTFEQALKAKRVLRNNQLTLAGLLFLGKIRRL